MRTDEEGNQCPSTLGEYLELCQAIGGEDCKAVQFLREKIAQESTGAAADVIAPDSQMRALLMPMLIQKAS